MKEYETYEIVISMKCPNCDTAITFNVQPLIDDYYKKDCPICNKRIKITARLRSE